MENFFIFTLNDTQEYCVNVFHVKEIIDLQAQKIHNPFNLSDIQKGFKGFYDLRGKVIKVYSLSEVLDINIKIEKSHNVLVIMSYFNSYIGFLINEAKDFVEIEESKPFNSKFIKNIVFLDNRNVLELAVEELFNKC